MVTAALDVQRLNPCKVIVRGPAALDAWREAQRVLVPGYQYMPRYQSGQWDGTWAPGTSRRYGDEWTLSASTGLARAALAALAGDAACLDVAQPADVDEFIALSPGMDKLREMQRTALRAALCAGWGRIALATNAGKGAVISMLARWARQRDQRVLVLCDEIAVYDALATELLTWTGFNVGQVRAGTTSIPSTMITLAMVQTLTKRLEHRSKNHDAWRAWMAEHGMLLLDEADKATAATWRAIIQHATNSTWRIGFSGTFPEDKYADLTLTNLMGPVLVTAKNRELIEAGVSAKPTVELHGFDVTSALRRVRWPDQHWLLRGASRRQIVYDAAISQCGGRHEFIASLITPNTPTAVIVNRIEHGHQLTAAIPGAVFLDGSTAPAERISVLNAFRDGQVMVLVVTKILDRGTNRLGHASDLIFASGEGSTRQTLQRIGRGLRRAGGKEFLRLVDVVDRVALSGADGWEMEKAADFIHSAGQARVKLYAEEGFDVVLNPPRSTA